MNSTHIGDLTSTMVEVKDWGSADRREIRMSLAAYRAGNTRGKIVIAVS